MRIKMLCDTGVYGTLLKCSLLSRGHVSIGFRCMVRRFSGSDVAYQYPGTRAPLSARRDVLPGPVYL